jgi:hypothetical protein
MAVIPFGEWRPDLTDYQADTSRLIVNVAPRADGYGPLKSQQGYTQALPGPCCGSFLAVDELGAISLFAGTATRLYKMNNGDLSWEDVSKGGVDYPGVPPEDNWTFAQFNDDVVACQINVPPQRFAIGSGTAFADIPGLPPQASYCTVVQQQLVLSGLNDDPHTIHWSARNDIEVWTLAVNGADIQSFPDGGAVLGVAGGEFGVVFQEAAIRRMTWLPGDERIFQFDRIAEGEGLRAPYSVVSAGSRIFFLGTSGFQMIMGGQAPVNISKERFGRFFDADWDTSEMRLMQGANEPNSSRVWFFYKSIHGAQSRFNRAILYDWVLERPTYVDAYSGYHASMMSQPGITLDHLEDIGFDNIDTMEISLDSFSASPGALLGIFGPDNKLGFLSGPNIEATVATAEQAFDTRYFVSQVRPCTDSLDVLSAVTYRNRLQDPTNVTAQSRVNAKGFCPHRIDTRMARFTNVIPAGANWTFAVGIDPLLVMTGKL